MITNDNAGWTLGLFMFAIFAFLIYMEPLFKYLVIGGIVGAGLHVAGATGLGLIVILGSGAYSIYRLIERENAKDKS